MKIKKVAIIIFILLCLLNLTNVFASGNVVQIQNSVENTTHIEVIDTGDTLPNTGIDNNNIFLILAIILILVSTIYSYKRIKDYTVQ